MEEENNINEPISKHIFMFPFKWDKTIGKEVYSLYTKRVNIKEILDVFRNDKNWTIEYNHTDKSPIERIEDYNEYTYFYNNVRDAIYGNDEVKKIEDKIVFNFSYKKNKTGMYIITCKDSTKQTQKYELQIDKIQLKIYSTGIGILSYFVSNYRYDSLKDINRINEYGRRIYPQYLDFETKKVGTIKENCLAESLEIKYRKENIDDDIDDVDIIEKFDGAYNEEGNRVAKIIEDILGADQFTSIKDAVHKERYLDKPFAIKPIIDDRMFVMCTFFNNEVSNRLKSTGEKYPYLEEKEWYEYVFCEPNGCCCTNKNLMKQKLESHTYARWSEYGTLYGISDYTFVALTNEGGRKFTDIQMQTMYYQMVCLLLAQRSSIRRFENELTDLSTYIRENGCKDEISQMVQEVNANYLCFTNAIYFREVTPQEQGIELYELAQEKMKINSNIKELKEDINELSQYASAMVNSKTENILNFLTHLSIIFMVPALLTGIAGMNILIDDKKSIMRNLEITTEIFIWGILFGVLFLCLCEPVQRFWEVIRKREIARIVIKIFLAIVCVGSLGIIGIMIIRP